MRIVLRYNQFKFKWPIIIFWVSFCLTLIPACEHNNETDTSLTRYYLRERYCSEYPWLASADSLNMTKNISEYFSGRGANVQEVSVNYLAVENNHQCGNSTGRTISLYSDEIGGEILLEHDFVHLDGVDMPALIADISIQVDFIGRRVSDQGEVTDTISIQEYLSPVRMSPSFWATIPITSTSNDFVGHSNYENFQCEDFVLVALRDSATGATRSEVLDQDTQVLFTFHGNSPFEGQGFAGIIHSSPDTCLSEMNVNISGADMYTNIPTTAPLNSIHEDNLTHFRFTLPDLENYVDFHYEFKIHNFLSDTHEVPIVLVNRFSHNDTTRGDWFSYAIDTKSYQGSSKKMRNSLELYFLNFLPPN